MPLDMSITLSTAGQQLSAVVSTVNKTTGAIDHTREEATELLTYASEALETLKYQSNLRMLEAYNFQRYFTDEEWYKVSMVLEVWAGRVEPGQVIARWDAIREENAALIANREAYARDNHLPNMCLYCNEPEPQHRPDCHVLTMMDNATYDSLTER